MTDDLVSRLLSAIQEREKAAETASCTGMAFVWARRNGRRTLQGHLALSADPDRVLRLCQAHRKIIALHTEGHDSLIGLCILCGVDGQEIDCTYPCDTLRALAEGYGIEAAP